MKKTYIGLTCLLLLALALFVALSFYGDSLERWHIKTVS